MVESLNDIINKKDEEISKLKENKFNKKDEIIAKKNELIARLENDLKDNSLMISKLTKENTLLKSENIELTKTKEQIQATIEESTHFLNDLQTKLKDSIVRLGDEKKQSFQSKATIETLNMRMKKLEIQLEKIQTNNEELRRENQILRSREVTIEENEIVIAKRIKSAKDLYKREINNLREENILIQQDSQRLLCVLASLPSWKQSLAPFDEDTRLRYLLPPASEKRVAKVRVGDDRPLNVPGREMLYWIPTNILELADVWRSKFLPRNTPPDIFNNLILDMNKLWREWCDRRINTLTKKNKRTNLNLKTHQLSPMDASYQTVHNLSNQYELYDKLNNKEKYRLTTSAIGNIMMRDQEIAKLSHDIVQLKQEINNRPKNEETFEIIQKLRESNESERDEGFKAGILNISTPISGLTEKFAQRLDSLSSAYQNEIERFRSIELLDLTNSYIGDLSKLSKNHRERLREIVTQALENRFDFLTEDDFDSDESM
eukprot:TRINITY_DN285_c0_g1_i1.p1 TRINITY_DN285_c0_g1~~TRINITY_DN285_c0_g1_i1.p1  ORF type:complete len:517 (+),score=162.50 TRINITY_DN285_c0_g1_i1:84-1553(+)